MRPAFELDLDVLDQRTLIGERLRASNDAIDAILVRRGEDLFGGDVRVAHHSVLGPARTAIPLVIIRKAHPQIGARAAKMQGCVALVVQQLRAGVEADIVRVPCANRIVKVGAGSGEDRVPQFGDCNLFGNLRKNCFRPGRRGGRDDRPVDVEADDQIEGRPVGFGPGPICARNLVRVLLGQKRGVVADDRQTSGTALVGRRHAVIQPAGCLVERVRPWRAGT